MSRPLVYMSGPISNGGTATPHQRMQNVVAASHTAALLIDAGFAVICPQLTEHLELNTARHFPHDVWMENDFPIVERVDVVLRLPGDSIGSDMETRHASEHGVPVVFGLPELEQWRASR